MLVRVGDVVVQKGEPIAVRSRPEVAGEGVRRAGSDGERVGRCPDRSPICDSLTCTNTSPRPVSPWSEVPSTSAASPPAAATNVGRRSSWVTRSRRRRPPVNPGPAMTSGTRIDASCGLRSYSRFRVRKWLPWSLANTMIVSSSRPPARSASKSRPRLASMLAQAAR
jgi:hypothetical protein